MKYLIIFCLVLIAVSIGTSCTANDLQHCCPGDRSGRFVPLVSKIADGGQINTEPFYESYINQSPVGLIEQQVGKLDSTTLSGQNDALLAEIQKIQAEMDSDRKLNSLKRQKLAGGCRIFWRRYTPWSIQAWS